MRQKAEFRGYLKGAGGTASGSRWREIKKKESRSFRLFLKRMIIAVLSRFFKNPGVPILRGPLRGKLLTLEIAEESLAMWTGRYEPHVVSTLLHLPDPIRVAYDVGAHVGFISLALAQRVGKEGKVYAFEPWPESYQMLEDLLALNDLKNVIQIVPVALDNIVSKVKLIVVKPTINLLDSGLDDQAYLGFHSEYVPTLTMDVFLSDPAHQPPDLIKVDIEGSEDRFLEGAVNSLQTHSPRLLMELHGPHKALLVWNLLKTFSYQWWQITSRGLEPIQSEKHLLSLFSPQRWVLHFVMARSPSMVS